MIIGGACVAGWDGLGGRPQGVQYGPQQGVHLGAAAYGGEDAAGGDDSADRADGRVGQVDVAQCRSGLIMPSYPEMRDAWTLLGMTEYQILAGEGGPPEDVAARAADEGWRMLAAVRDSG